MSSVMSKERFEKTNYKMSYDEYRRCYCPDCNEKENCIHAGAFRRVPEIDGGLGLCPRLRGE